MNNRRGILLLAGILGFAFLVWMIIPPGSREPSYGGKPLSYWVLQIDTPTEPHDVLPEEAIRHIGTNALPFLMKWLRDDPIGNGRQESLGAGATKAFIALGSAAESTLPELSRLMSDTNPSPAFRAGEILGKYGKEALPIFLTKLTNRQDLALFPACAFVKYLGTNARPAVPALCDLLDHQWPELRMQATNALLKIDPEALNRATQH